MSGRPAARVGDPTAHGNPLGPGPGSLDVLIGGRPAWRGLSPATVGQLLGIAKDVAEDAAKVLAAPNEALRVKPLKDMGEGIGKMAGIIASADQHACAVVKLVVPDGNGVVIDGSTTVLINGLPACRMGDTIQEATAVNNIAVGEMTVLIGGPSPGCACLAKASQNGAAFVDMG